MGVQWLRLLVWLVPCPEAQLLLLDWAWAVGAPPPGVFSGPLTYPEAISSTEQFLRAGPSLLSEQQVVCMHGVHGMQGGGRPAQILSPLADAVAAFDLQVSTFCHRPISNTTYPCSHSPSSSARKTCAYMFLTDSNRPLYVLR